MEFKREFDALKMEVEEEALRVVKKALRGEKVGVINFKAACTTLHFLEKNERNIIAKEALKLQETRMTLGNTPYDDRKMLKEYEQAEDSEGVGK